MLKNNKGISLITAVMTVLLLIIILTTISYTAINNTKVKKINGFYSDLRLITDEVQLYYAEHNKLPVEDIFYTITETTVEKETDGSKDEYASIASASLNFILKEGKTSYSFDNLYNPNDYNTNSDVPKSIYYQIDLNKFNNLTLNNPDLIYLVNEQSKTVYCYEGIEVDGKLYHKLPLEYIEAVPTYSLTFLLDSISETIYLSKDKAIKVYFPESAPVKTGLEFTGWYYDKECTQISVEGNDLKKNTVLYAGWK